MVMKFGSKFLPFFWVVVVGCGAVVEGQMKRYDQHSVLRIKPQNHFQLESLLQLQENGVDFWREPDQVNRLADLMVSPENRLYVVSFLEQRSIDYEIIIPDVQKSFDRERQEMLEAERKISFLSITNESCRAKEAITGFWNSYQRYDKHNQLMDALESQNSGLVEKITIGQSYQKRDINLIRIGANSNSNKPAVFIEGGIHAREWISPATVTYFAQQLVNGWNNKDTEIVDLLNTYDFYILPIINVDGYEYTHTNTRLWRKTLKPSATSPNCLGADPNRNFGYEWGGSGASSNPCSETFRGDNAFSEPETKAESDFILKNLKGRAKIYLAVHSYGQYFLYPWGYTSALTPHDSELNAKAKSATQALASRYGTKYTIGTSTNVLYAAAGGADDWAYGSASITYSYTVELRDTGWYGFQLPASQIIPTGEETTDAFIAISKAVKDTLKL